MSLPVVILRTPGFTGEVRAVMNDLTRKHAGGAKGFRLGELHVLPGFALFA